MGVGSPRTVGAPRDTLGIVGRLAFSASVTLAGTAWAQQQEPAPEDVAVCAACGGVLILIPIAVLILNIALLVWVARDAKARGMDNAVVWMIVVMITGVIGLIIYLFSRPPGEMVKCPHCQGKRLKASSKCPHCGNP